MDVDQVGQEASEDKPMKSTYKMQDFIWTLERAQNLMKTFTDSQEQQRPLFIDPKGLQKVTVKLQCI
jgi:hypothetical protein